MNFTEALNKLNETWGLPKEEIEAALPLMQEIVDAVPEINGYKMQLDRDNFGYFEKEINKDGEEEWFIPILIDGTLYDDATWTGNEYGDFDPRNCDIEPYHAWPQSVAEDEIIKPLNAKLPIETDKFIITKTQVDDADGYDCVPDESKDYTEKRGDAGIGSYEYWGTSGYDSRPYTEFEGTAKFVGGQVFGAVTAIIKK